MSRRIRRAMGVPVLLSALAGVVVCACHHAEPGVTYHVDAATGSDAGSGTADHPFKSISRGLRGARSGDVVRVAPGTYDSAMGEVFPLTLADGVSLLGDEVSKGAGITPTAIVGGDVVRRGFSGTAITATIDPGQGSTIAGFTITNDNPATDYGCYGVFVGAGQNTAGSPVRHDHVTIRNNTLTGALHDAAIAFTGEGADGHIVTGNRIVDNIAGHGIRFGPGGIGSKLEDNVITGNVYGVELDSPGDLGGGPSSSAGGNVISCNIYNVLIVVGTWNEGLWRSYPPEVIPAANDFWDHVPPVVCRQAGDPACDICISAPWEIAVTTAGARRAPSVCP